MYQIRNENVTKMYECWNFDTILSHFENEFCQILNTLIFHRLFLYFARFLDIILSQFWFAWLFVSFFCQFYVTTFFLLHICYIFSFMGPTFSKSTPISTLSRIFIIYNTLLETCMFEFRLFKRINQHNCPLSSPSTNITSN